MGECLCQQKWAGETSVGGIIRGWKLSWGIYPGGNVLQRPVDASILYNCTFCCGAGCVQINQRLSAAFCRRILSVGNKTRFFITHRPHASHTTTSLLHSVSGATALLHALYTNVLLLLPARTQSLFAEDMEEIF